MNHILSCRNISSHYRDLKQLLSTQINTGSAVYLELTVNEVDQYIFNRDA